MLSEVTDGHNEHMLSIVLLPHNELSHDEGMVTHLG